MLMTLTLILSATLAQAQSVDLDKSAVTWEAKKVVSGGNHGDVKILKADLVSEKGELKKGLIVIDIASADVKDLEGEWKTKFLGHIKSGDFFEVEKYPTAKLEVEKIKEGKAYGKLTIKDKTHDVVIPFKKTGSTLEGSLVIDRTQYGIIYGSTNFFKNLGDKAISNEFKVDFKLVLK